jgi:hypothetical protein
VKLSLHESGLNSLSTVPGAQPPEYVKSVGSGAPLPDLNVIEAMVVVVTAFQLTPVRVTGTVDDEPMAVIGNEMATGVALKLTPGEAGVGAGVAEANELPMPAARRPAAIVAAKPPFTMRETALIRFRLA